MSPASVFASGRTALITGGANGIGFAVAQLCRKHQMKVSIVDSNPEYIKHAKTKLEDADYYEMDVTSPEAWSELKTKIGGAPDFLMLNSGIGLKGTYGDSEYFRKIFDVNFFGVVNGLNTFVPSISSEKKPVAIVITGSKQGITNPPGNVAYNASKSAVKTLAEHLSWDLRDTGTSVHLLVPGWTYTGLSGNTPGTSKEKPEGAWWPDQVADYLYQKMSEGKFYVICPDNDVSEETDRKRMAWATGDIIEGRLPLSRWRTEYKEEVQKALG
ncbi:uncharacterized protein PV09_04597 [Verruconis gallopava]|uniref:Short chain dehydrogenase/reductase n=1 Tax=Verruconis gallopava TaxID=253628 RepID=A0A0D2ABT8_9PEZI|nr:uncharacterized protein PV09_04597 [Verruconis gallopava]KIW04303.1 hypothetical protein PV09_04597 [Verruconis gallopava]